MLHKLIVALALTGLSAGLTQLEAAPRGSRPAPRPAPRPPASRPPAPKPPPPRPVPPPPKPAPKPPIVVKKDRPVVIKPPVVVKKDRPVVIQTPIVVKDKKKDKPPVVATKGKEKSMGKEKVVTKPRPKDSAPPRPSPGSVEVKAHKDDAGSPLVVARGTWQFGNPEGKLSGSLGAGLSAGHGETGWALTPELRGEARWQLTPRLVVEGSVARQPERWDYGIGVQWRVKSIELGGGLSAGESGPAPWFGLRVDL